MQIPILNGEFFVYEHIRADSGVVFYVGKGRGNRAVSAHARSEFWRRIVAKAGGFIAQYVCVGACEEFAFLCEVERIDQLRRRGLRLCNMTDGGEGASGWVKTPEWREKVGAAHRGKVVSPETRAKISASVRAREYRHSEDARRRMSASQLGHRRNVGRIQSEQEKIKRADSLRGNKSRAGQTRSPEERAKVSAALSGRKQSLLTCPHCMKSGGNAMRRWHFDACREKP